MRDDYAAVARRSARERERAEYNQFGPWMQAVKSASELPPRFDAYWEELSAASVVAKVPYRVERREALPGSDLYEELFAVLPEGLLFLGIEGGSVRRVDLPYEKISWIALVVDLLDARFIVGLSEGDRREMSFNAVSEPLALEIASIVRSRLRASVEPARPRELPDFVAAPRLADDFLFDNLLGMLRRREKVLSLVAYQGPYRVAPSAEGKRSPLWLLREAFSPTYLDSSMILELPGELVVVQLGREARRSRKGHRVETAWVPLSSLLPPRIEERRLANGGLVYALLLETKGGGRELLLASPPEASLARLAALASAPKYLQGEA
jgi:hypothetical protein